MSLLIAGAFPIQGNGLITSTPPPSVSPSIDFSVVPFEGEVNTELVNVTEVTNSPAGYYGWGIPYGYQGIREFAYRFGDVHIFSPGSELVRFKTSDGGFTYSRILLRAGEAGVDSRNLGGGNSPEGIVCIFFGRWGNNGNTWLSMRCLRTTNGFDTVTESDDLPLYPGVVKEFSPHGPIAINPANTEWKQTAYGDNADSSVSYIWFWKSVDKGITWTDPTLVVSGTALYEPALVDLGDDKLICLVREDISPSIKKTKVYNSSDNGDTWTFIGNLSFDGADVSGIAPRAYKKDDDHIIVLSTWRGQINNFTELSLAFGSSEADEPTRFINPGTFTRVDVNNLEFGYPGDMDFTGTDGGRLMNWYDLSDDWESGEAITKIMVGPVFRKQYTWKNIKATGLSNGSLIAGNVVQDELACYKYGVASWQNYIREQGDYTIRITGDFNGNSSGISRQFRIRKYNINTGSPVSVLHTESFSNTDNTFDFTTPAFSLDTPDAIVIDFFHDAGGTISTDADIFITKS